MAGENTTELQKQLELFEKIANKKLEIGNLDAAELRSVTEMASLISQNKDTLQELLRIKQGELQTLKSSEQLYETAAQRREEDIARLQFVLEKNESITDNIRTRAQDIKEYNKDLDIQGQAIKNNTAAMYASLNAEKASNKAGQETTATIIANSERNKKNLTELGPNMQKELQGTPAWLGAAGSFVLAGLKDMALGIPIAIGESMGESVTKVQTGVIGAVDGINTSFKGILKDTGYYSEGLMDTFINTMTGRQDNVKQLVDEMGRDISLLSDVYIDTSDSAASIKALHKSANVFHETMRDGKGEWSGYMANFVAGFEKIGVSTESSAKAINIANKALGKSPYQSVEFLKKIKAVGTSLGQDINQTFSDMTSMAKDIVMFGDDVVDVFGGIAAQARAAGMETTSLLEVAMKFDTFEGAAEAAGKLNAVLGETAIDVMELVHADPDEKIDIIREAVEGTIGSFDDMDRRTKQVIAGIVTGGDVMKASQIFGNAEQFEAYSKGLSTAAEDTEKLQEQMARAATMEEISKGVAGDMANIIKLVTEKKEAFTQILYDTATAVTDQISGVDNIATASAAQAFTTWAQALGDNPAQAFAGAEAIGPIQGFAGAANEALVPLEQKLASMTKSAEGFHKALGGDVATAAKSIEDLKAVVQTFAGGFQGFKEVAAGTVEEKLEALPAAATAFSKSLAGQDEGMLKFNSGLLQTATSAAALEASLRSMGNVKVFDTLAEKLNVVSSAMDATKPKELASHEDISEASSVFKKDAIVAPVPPAELMDRRTRQALLDSLDTDSVTFDHFVNTRPPGAEELPAFRPSPGAPDLEPLLSKLGDLMDKLDKVVESKTLSRTLDNSALDVTLIVDANTFKPTIKEVVENMRS